MVSAITEYLRPGPSENVDFLLNEFSIFNSSEWYSKVQMEYGKSLYRGRLVVL
jgi:hypothetical protein